MGKRPLRLLTSTIVLFVFLSGCQSEQEQSDTTNLADIATRYAAAWSSQNPEELASFYAVNGSLRVNNGEPSIGRDAVTETARAFMTAFPEMVVRLVERGYELWTLDEDGRIVESLGHFDDAEYRRQLNAGAATIESES